MKKTKVIIPALGLLVLSTAASISGTVAWFSLNTKVSMSGMSVTTKVSSNLMIAASTAGTTSAGEAAFSSSATQAVSGILEPVSTINGVNFFYTTNGKADGDAAAEVYTAYDPDDAGNPTAFASAYGVNGAVAYVDYVFELKAINTDTSNAKYIDLTKVDLVYTGTAVDIQKAFRAAIFVQEGTYGGIGALTGYNALAATANTIMDVTGAANQTADTAVSSTSALSAIGIMATTSTNSIQVAANSTKYFKVTQRFYIEGEDTTCTNATFLELTDAWKINVNYTLGGNSAASITEISKFAAKSVTIGGASPATEALYYDGTNLFRVSDMEQLNTGSTLPSALLNSDQLSALNTAFGSSFTLAA